MTAKSKLATGKRRTLKVKFLDPVRGSGKLRLTKKREDLFFDRLQVRGEMIWA